MASTALLRSQRLREFASTSLCAYRSLTSASKSSPLGHSWLSLARSFSSKPARNDIIGIKEAWKDITGIKYTIPVVPIDIIGIKEAWKDFPGIKYTTPEDPADMIDDWRSLKKCVNETLPTPWGDDPPNIFLPEKDYSPAKQEPMTLVPYKVVLVPDGDDRLLGTGPEVEGERILYVSEDSVQI